MSHKTEVARAHEQGCIRSGNLQLRSFLRYWAYMFGSLHKRLFDKSMRAERLLYVDEIIDAMGFSLAALAILCVQGPQALDCAHAGKLPGDGKTDYSAKLTGDCAK